MHSLHGGIHLDHEHKRDMCGVLQVHVFPEYVQVVCLVCCRCVAALTSMGGLLAGAVLWPALADSLSHTYKILPGEMVLAGIIHNVQLILSIEIPALYMALQVNLISSFNGTFSCL